MYWNLLKTMREEGVTIKDLGLIIGKSRNSVQNKLKRKYDFTYNEMLAIKSALKSRLSLEKLFFWDAKKDAGNPTKNPPASEQ